MRLLGAWGVLALCCACPVEPAPQGDGGAVDAGCQPGTFQTADGACRAAGWTDCGPGFAPDPSGWGCEAVLAACGAGAIAVPGGACDPVGWARCPPGFTGDPSGWSCEPLLPTLACTGATRAALGAAACQPIGDCSAPFPPPGATLFVDADAGVLDATHFARVSDALAVAPAGAIIALAAGSYRETLTPTRPVKLVGQCAARVQLGGDPALAVSGVGGVEVEGVTVRDSLLAARIELGGGLTLRHAVLEANLRSAVQALDPNTTVTLEDVVIRGTRPDPGTQTFGQGVAASYAARVTLTDVELSQNGETGVFVDRAGTRAVLTRVVLQGTLPRASTGKLGWGLAVQGGAALEATATVVQDNRVTGLLVAQAGSTASLIDTLVRRTSTGLDNAGLPTALGVSVMQGGALTWAGGAVESAPTALVLVTQSGSTASLRELSARGERSSFALSAQDGAHLGLERVAVLGALGAGVQALTGAEVTVAGVAVLDVGAAGLHAQDTAHLTGSKVEVRRHGGEAALSTGGALLSLTGCVLADAVTAPDGGFRGSGAAAAGGGVLTLAGCLVDRNASSGLYAASGGTLLSAVSTVVRATQLDDRDEFGQGAVAERGARLELEDVAVVGNHTAGVQVADVTGSLELVRVTVRGTLPNAEGTRGRGANASFGGELLARDSALVDNQQVGVFAFQSRVELLDTVVIGTRADPDGRFGNGLESLTDATILCTRGAVQQSAGLGAVFAEGAGVLDGARVAQNPVGLHAQDGSTIEELVSPPPTLGPRQVVITSATTFEGNQAKVSAGTVPVPPR